MICEACGINRRPPKQAIVRPSIGDMVLCSTCYNQARLLRGSYIIGGLTIEIHTMETIKSFMIQNRDLWRKL